ncbi:MAG: hypothetical protein LBH48_08335 [Bifidobacteriaceae bacterium]|nr:hypothetical protein [Bifidobacteriaceae bacterium]
MNTVHPTAIVGDGVQMGDGNVIGPWAVIAAGTRLGSDNWIGAGCVIGGLPEIRGYPHPADWIEQAGEFGVVIGDGNVIREQVTISRGSRRQTRVGGSCFLMTRVQLAHDVELSDGVTCALGAILAGHVRLGQAGNVGAAAVVHQFRVIGPGAMVGQGSVVTRDVPPFAKVHGNPARLHGANQVGMTRQGIPPQAIQTLESCYAAAPAPSGDGAPLCEPPEPMPAALAPQAEWWQQARRN